MWVSSFVAKNDQKEQAHLIKSDVVTFFATCIDRSRHSFAISRKYTKSLDRTSKMRITTNLIGDHMNSIKHLIQSLLIGSTLLGVQAWAADLTVEVTGISQAKGDIHVAIFDQQGQWLRKAVASKKISAVEGKVQIVFENLPDGEYGLSAFHDLNSNGKLDANMIGIPTEPYGFSNDAAGSFGPPSFAEIGRAHV